MTMYVVPIWPETPAYQLFQNIRRHWVTLANKVDYDKWLDDGDEHHLEMIIQSAQALLALRSRQQGG